MANGKPGRLGLGGLLALAALLAASLRADFLEQAGPVEAKALGGNLVALDQPEAAAYHNPAALAGLSRYVVSASYQQLYAGIPGDDLGLQEISLMAPQQGPGGLDLSWDHFGADLLEQDRLRLAYGLSLAGADWFSLGAGASLLYQRYTLTEPLPGVDAAHLSAEGGSLDLGVALRPWPDLSLGASVQDLNEPDLGVVGVDRLPRTVRWGLALDHPAWNLKATLAQSLALDLYQTQAGLQWTYPGSGLAFRGGVNTQSASVGLGFTVGWLVLDYAYVWSVGAGPSGDLPGSHAVALSAVWGAPARRIWPWRDLAEAAAGEGRWEDAALFYRRALEQQPGDAGLRQDLAGVQARLDRQRAAAYFAAGRKAEAVGAPGDAVADYRWAVHLDPATPDYAAALARAQAALPAMADPRFQARLASVLERLGEGRPRRALEELQALRRDYPGEAPLASLESDLKTRLRKPARATLRAMEEALRYASQGQAALARRAWQKVLRNDPDNALARQALLRADAKPTPVAPAQQAQAQELFNRGLTAYQAGDLPKAMDLWQQVLRLDPGHLDAQNNLLRARAELEERR